MLPKSCNAISCYAMRRTPTRKDSDGELSRLLTRYRCPMPFHAVRGDKEVIRRFADARVEELDALVNGLVGDVALGRGDHSSRT